MSGLPLYVSFMAWTPKARTGTDEHRAIGTRHLQFQLDNQDRGVLLGAGPIDANRKEEVQHRREAGLDKGPAIDAFGMSIFAAPSLEEAERLWREEPFEQIGWREHNLCTFSIEHGAAHSLAEKMIAAGPDPNFQPRTLTREDIAPRLAQLHLFMSFMRPTVAHQARGERAEQFAAARREFHLANEQAGRLLAAGPLLSGSGRRPPIDAEAWMIFVASSLEDAAKLAAAHPLVQAGWYDHTLCTWQMNEGTAIPLVREMIAKL